MRKMLQKSMPKLLATLMISSAIVMGANAQTTYTGDFEGATATGYLPTDTNDVNGKDWIYENAIVGNDTAKDIKNGLKAARLRHQTANIARLELVENLTNITSISFKYSRSLFSGDTSGVSPQFTVSYTMNDGVSWTVIDTIDLAGVSTLTTATYTMTTMTGEGRIKFETISGDDGKRFNIDDIVLVSTSPTNINIISKTPASSGIPLTTSQLSVKFDKPITVGTGNVKLINMESAAVQTFTPADITISASNDSTAVIDGITLANNSGYFVTMTEGIFHETGSPLNVNSEITSTDTFNWYFYTEDTVAPPAAPVLTSLNTTFGDCEGDTMSVFVQYNELGTAKRWRCSTFGNGDSNAVYINGGSAAGVSEQNKDWLISIAKYNFSAMSNPAITFFNKRRFDGDVTLKLKISTNYTGYGDPNAATWTDVATIAKPTTDNTWISVPNIDLTGYKATPFFIAFTYECATTGAYEYTLDDIKVVNMTGIFNPNNYNTQLNVLGNPTNNGINLMLESKSNDNFTLEVYDLNGKNIYAEQFVINQGANKIEIKNVNLASGMYFVRAYNGKGLVGATKAVVK